jgi:hypothetical protein
MEPKNLALSDRSGLTLIAGLYKYWCKRVTSGFECISIILQTFFPQ